MSSEPKQIKDYSSCTSPSTIDVLLGQGNNQSNTFKYSISNLLGNTSNLSLVTNTITIQNSNTPASSTITVPKGRMWYDTDYLYIAVSNNVVKRVALSSF